MRRPNVFPKRDWTQEEDARLRRLWGKKTIVQIARRLKRTPNAVGLRANSVLGLRHPKRALVCRGRPDTCNFGQWWSADEDARLLAEGPKTLTWVELLKKFPDRSREAIQARMHKLKVPGLGMTRRGRRGALILSGVHYNWCVTDKGRGGKPALYVVLSNKAVGCRNTLLHRKVFELNHGPIPDGFQVHHINGNTLDNRPANLELAKPGRHQDRDREIRDLLYTFVKERGLLDVFEQWRRNIPARVETMETLYEKSVTRGFLEVIHPDGTTIQYAMKEIA